MPERPFDSQRNKEIMGEYSERAESIKERILSFLENQKGNTDHRTLMNTFTDLDPLWINRALEDLKSEKKIQTFKKDNAMSGKTFRKL